MSYRIAVDTGGTFTDVVVADAQGHLVVGKSLTTPERTYDGFSAALANAAEIISVPVETLLGETEVLIYGTTRSTNSIVEKKTAKTALLLTEGFPDILLYRQGGKREPLNLEMEFPPPYVPRRLTFEIPERINAEGGIEKALDEAVARDIIMGLVKMNIEAVAVSLLWSIANSAHEKRLGKLIAEILPGIPYTLSHQLNPIIREYPRTSSTAIDASLKPLMQSHLSEFESDLRAANYQGEILVSACSGGVMHVKDVVEKPIYTVKSGPAMAPLAGIAYAEAEREGNDVIIVDTGGTTFDVSMVRAGQIKFTRETWLLGEWIGHNLGLSSVDVRSVGAGGGSIAWIDSGGLLRVGPKSAGAVPGPACYGRGGEEATVTDAAVVLGYIDPNFFLGGRMALDVAAAHKAVSAIAYQIKMSAEQAAFAIITIAGEQMIKAIQEITVQDGVNPAESILVAGGGAAGINILPIAKALGCAKVLVPRTAGALSACGGQYSDIVAEFSASQYAHSGNFDFTGVDRALSGIARKIDSFSEELRERGITQFNSEYFVEARYINQQWEMEFAMPQETVQNAADVEALVQTFHDVHFRRYAMKEEGGAIECVNWKGRLSAILNKPNSQEETVGESMAPEAKRVSQTYFGGDDALDAPVYVGIDLSPGAKIAGPAIIEEPTTTIVVYPGATARVTDRRNYMLETETESKA
ncbi:MAG: hydantoinase/oxoprolinase family protein [Alphaproteobacteria bacterium]